MGFWFLLFFVTPILEMYLLIEVGSYIGALYTIGLVMLTAVIGLALLRVQGLATLTRGMDRLQRGELPAQEVAEGLLLAVAGAVLITPGFVTDAIGFVLLLPVGRAAVARRLAARFGPSVTMQTGGYRYETHDERVIEGELEPRPKPTNSPPRG